MVDRVTRANASPDVAAATAAFSENRDHAVESLTDWGVGEQLTDKRGASF